MAGLLRFCAPFAAAVTSSARLTSPPSTLPQNAVKYFNDFIASTEVKIDCIPTRRTTAATAHTFERYVKDAIRRMRLGRAQSTEFSVSDIKQAVREDVLHTLRLCSDGHRFQVTQEQLEAVVDTWSSVDTRIADIQRKTLGKYIVKPTVDVPVFDLMMAYAQAGSEGFYCFPHGKRGRVDSLEGLAMTALQGNNAWWENNFSIDRAVRPAAQAALRTCFQARNLECPEEELENYFTVWGFNFNTYERVQRKFDSPATLWKSR